MSKFNRKFVRLIALICLINLSADLGWAVTIRFQTQAKVSKPIVYLGDIAEITNGTPEMISRYQQIKLAPSPPAGGHCILDFDSARNRIIALGLSNGELEFAGQSRILVTAISNSPAETPNAVGVSSIQRVNHEQPLVDYAQVQAERIILHAIRNDLKASLEPSEFALAEIDVQFRRDDAERILGTSHLDWKIEGWTETIEQPQTLVFTKKLSSAAESGIHVQCHVKMPPKTLSVNSFLPMGHVMTASDLTWAYSKQLAEPIALEQVIGMETKHPLRPGKPISMNDLRIKPYVRARDLVSVHARQRGILVKRTMRALGTGGLGETIELVTLDGKDRFTARVTGYHETEILESNPKVAP
jgi:flagella basal body P-ring formation protein FlgA